MLFTTRLQHLVHKVTYLSIAGEIEGSTKEGTRLEWSTAAVSRQVGGQWGKVYSTIVSYNDCMLCVHMCACLYARLLSKNIIRQLTQKIHVQCWYNTTVLLEYKVLICSHCCTYSNCNDLTLSYNKWQDSSSLWPQFATWESMVFFVTMIGELGIVEYLLLFCVSM